MCGLSIIAVSEVLCREAICLEQLMICVHRDVVFSIKLLVPVIHARDNDKTLLLNLNVILVGVVQCVRYQTERPIIL